MKNAAPAQAHPLPLAFFALLALLAATAAIAAGCAHYHLGTGAKLPFKTIALAPIVNDTDAPATQALLHQQLADALAAENGLTLVAGADGADVLLRVRLAAYTREVAATDPRDTVLGTSFNLRLTARCTLEDRRAGGKPLFSDRPVRASAVAHSPAGGAATGYSAVETQTLPVLTRELARKIRDTVTGAW